MKIGVAADLHFGRGGDAGVAHYRDSLREMTDGMIIHGVELAIFAGDLFERWRWFNPRTYRILSLNFKKLLKAGIRVILIPGNHDYDIAGTFPAIMPFEDIGVEIVTEPKIFIEQCGLFVFLPWITKGMAREKGINVKQPATEINRDIVEKLVAPILLEAEKLVKGHEFSHVVFHASVFGADFGEMRCVEAVEFTLAPEIFEGVGYTHVVGGHFHKRQEHRGMTYVGAMQRQTFGERDNPTGWLLLDGAEKRFVELQKTIRFMQYEWDFSNPETPGEMFYQYLEEVVRGRAPERANVKFHYRIQANETLNRAKVMSAFYGAGAISVTLEAEYLDAEQQRTPIRAEQDFITQFEEWLRVNPDKDPDRVLRVVLEHEKLAGFVNEIPEGHFESLLKG